MRSPSAGRLLLVTVSVTALSALTVWFQWQHLGRHYLETEQMERHAAIIEGRTGSPFQYRVLSELVVEGALRVARAVQLRRPEVTALLLVRAVQQLLIFSVALAYLRSLGLSLRERLLGIAFLAAGMTNAIHNSDLSFNTYSELLFYLLAAWATVAERLSWTLPLTVLAALNRETGGLLPLLVLWPLLSSWPPRWEGERRRLFLALGGLVAFAGVFAGLRAWFGLRPGYWANPWGWQTVVGNFSDTRTLALMLATMSLLPLICVWRLRRLPPVLRGFFWILIPVWFAAHAWIARLKETRYFLMPLAVVFVPAALLPLNGADPQDPSRGTSRQHGSNRPPE